MISAQAVRYIILTLLMVGCRLAALESNTGSSAASNMLLPEEKRDSFREDFQDFKVEVAESGKLRSLLVLRLDYFPDAGSSKTSLPACFKALPPDFVLGTLHCDGKPGSERQLFVRNVEQQCYTNPEIKAVHVQEPVRFPDCEMAVVALKAFDPVLRVDTELR